MKTFIFIPRNNTSVALEIEATDRNEARQLLRDMGYNTAGSIIHEQIDEEPEYKLPIDNIHVNPTL